jgi:hypothetical protein
MSTLLLFWHCESGHYKSEAHPCGKIRPTAIIERPEQISNKAVDVETKAENNITSGKPVYERFLEATYHIFYITIKDVAGSTILAVKVKSVVLLHPRW